MTPQERVAALRGFAREVLKDWPESGPDMFDIQDAAVRHGLLVGEERKPPCDPEHCFCAEYHGEGEAVMCYRRSDIIEGRAVEDRP